ncbi:MAG TPA: hypothetical protein VFL49_08285, partial [Pseudolabrys sp.]|nr:hypothetical protein [Pseudolabrys sp.]
KKRAEIFRKWFLKIFIGKACGRERGLENIYGAGNLLTKFDTDLPCVLVPRCKVGALGVKQ